MRQTHLQWGVGKGYEMRRTHRVLGQVGKGAGVADEPRADDLAYERAQVGSHVVHALQQVRMQPAAWNGFKSLALGCESSGEPPGGAGLQRRQRPDLQVRKPRPAFSWAGS